MGKCEALMEKLIEARLSAEQNAISAKADITILNTATEKHKQVTEEYRPAISCPRDTSARSGTAQHTSAKPLRKPVGPAQQVLQPYRRGFSRDPLPEFPRDPTYILLTSPHGVELGNVAKCADNVPLVRIAARRRCEDLRGVIGTT